MTSLNEEKGRGDEDTAREAAGAGRGDKNKTREDADAGRGDGDTARDDEGAGRDGENEEHTDGGGAGTQKRQRGSGGTRGQTNGEETAQGMLAFLIEQQKEGAEKRKSEQSAADKKQANKDQEAMIKSNRLDSKDEMRLLMWIQEHHQNENLIRALKDMITQNHWLKQHLPVAYLRGDSGEMDEDAVLQLVFETILSLAKSRGASEKQDVEGLVAFWYLEVISGLETNREVFGSSRTLTDVEDALKKVIAAVGWLFGSLVETLKTVAPTQTVFNELYLKLCVNKQLIPDSVRRNMCTRVRNMKFSDVTEQVRGEAKMYHEDIPGRRPLPGNSFGRPAPPNTYSAGSGGGMVCRYGSRCNTPGCSFIHPRTMERQQTSPDRYRRPSDQRRYSTPPPERRPDKPSEPRSATKRERPWRDSRTKSNETRGEGLNRR